jgi:hypothetical protein
VKESTIENSGQKLTFKECKDEICRFEYTNSDGLIKEFNFSLQYYEPATNENGTASGAYLFKPELDDQSAHVYSKF